MGFTRISNSQINSRGATTLPNQPQISAIALKEEFDAPAKQIVAPAVNNLMDELEASTSANNVGAVAPTGRTGTTVQGVINSVSTDLATLETNAGQAIADAHTHDNKALLDTYTQTEADIADAVSKKHEHSNKALLDSYTQTEADIADSVSKKHSHSNKALLDTYAQSETDLADAVSKKHAHSNKALLDTYSQSESDLADAVSKKHSHTNKTVLDDLSDNGGALNYKGNPIGGGSVNDAYKSVKVTSGVDDTTISASGEDTFELHAGNNVTLSVDTTSTPKKITVNSTGGGGGGSYTPGDGIDISGTTISLDYGLLVGSNLTKPVVGKDIADALDGKADTSDIPANLSDLADDTTHRTVTDTEKATWNAKAPITLLDDTVGWDCRNKVINYNTARTITDATFTPDADDNGIITINTSATTAADRQYPFNISTSNTEYMIDADVLRDGNDWYLSGGSDETGNTYSVRIFYRLANGSAISDTMQECFKDEVKLVVPSTAVYASITVFVYSGKTVSNKVVKPMIAPISGAAYKPYHKSVEDWYWENNPNAGVHQLLPYNVDRTKALNPSSSSVSWSGNVCTLNGGTITLNSDETYTIDGTFTELSSFFIFKRDATGANIYRFSDGDYKLTGGSNNVKLTPYCTRNGSYYDYGTDTGNGVDFTVLSTDGNSGLTVYISSGTYSNYVLKPLLTDISDTCRVFSKYAMTNRELTPLAFFKEVRTGTLSFDNAASEGLVDITYDKPFESNPTNTTFMLVLNFAGGNASYMYVYTVVSVFQNKCTFKFKNIAGDTSSSLRNVNYIAGILR